MTYKKWSLWFIAIVFVVLLVIVSFTIIIDPLFHYHPPLENLEYPISDERYQNDGILRNFDYDAIIIGTSMTQNFKTTQLDSLFNVNSVKTPFSGASFKEINDVLFRALDKNPNVRMIVRGLDVSFLLDDKDRMMYDEDTYPWYLYDDLLFNDTSYVLNKDILREKSIRVLEFTHSGRKTPTFDEYNNWMRGKAFGAEAILKSYDKALEKAEHEIPLTEEDFDTFLGNMTQNILSLAKEHPDVELYYFFTPYSIYWWGDIKYSGDFDRHILLLEEASRLMLEYENIKLFCFFDAYDVICNPDNYKDITHYSEDINSMILQWMRDGEHQLTKDNYQQYWKDIGQFYDSYDYEQLFNA